MKAIEQQLHNIVHTLVTCLIEGLCSPLSLAMRGVPSLPFPLPPLTAPSAQDGCSMPLAFTQDDCLEFEK